MNIKEGKINKFLIFQGENGAIELIPDITNEGVVWASAKEIARLFGRNKSTISRHIQKIYDSNELLQEATVAKNATVRLEGDRTVRRSVDYYHLDMILSVGYRVNSAVAIQFRKWATELIKQHITQGYTINKRLLEEKESLYLQALDDIRQITAQSNLVSNGDILNLIQAFSRTWFSLDRYDKGIFAVEKREESVGIDSSDLIDGLVLLKSDLLGKGEATEIFGQEREVRGLQGIIGNVFQSIQGKDVYPSIEEKAAHLLYFIVKNHPFVDGNKRSGAFAFIWFLERVHGEALKNISPEALTSLTLLVAESNPRDKDKMIGLILLLLNISSKKA